MPQTNAGSPKGYNHLNVNLIMSSGKLSARGNATPGSGGSLYNTFIALNGLRNNVVQPLLQPLTPSNPASPQLSPSSTDRDLWICGASDDLDTSASLSPDPADLTLPTGGATHPIFPYYVSKEERANSAIISFNTFSIISPPIPLFFGTDTSEKLNNSTLDALITSFFDNFTPFKWDCMMQIVLDIDDIDPRCINRDITKGRSAPDLKLTLSGDLPGKVLVACGGYHRYVAVWRIMATLNKRIEALEKKRGSWMDGTPTLIDIDKELRCIMEQRAFFSTWGVIVYDAAKVSAHNLIDHLSGTNVREVLSLH